MGGVEVTHVILGDGGRTARVAEVWSEPGVGFRGSMSPSLAMDLGMCEREGGTYRRAGTLAFTPDGEEADAACGERVVSVRYEAGGWRANGHLISPDVAHLVFGDWGGGRDYILCRVTPDAPKPVAVWERPPREGGWVYGYICSACGAPL